MASSAGSARTSLALVLGTLALGLVALGSLASSVRAQPEARLRVHAAAALRLPMEACAASYEERFGVPVELSFGGSGALLGALQIGAPGDLFVAADDGFVQRAQGAGLVLARADLASMAPTLAVRAGNPAGLEGLEDLARPGLDVGLADPQAAACGAVARLVLEEQGLWPAVHAGLKVTKPTEPELATDLELGALDAAILWSPTVARQAGLAALPDPALDGRRRTVAAASLRASERPAEAARFLRFLADPAGGGLAFRAAGFGAPGERAPWPAR